MPLSKINFNLDSARKSKYLNGELGRFRADLSLKQIDANNDFEAIQEFLDGHKGTPPTYRTYTKECERLQLWAILHLNKAVSDLTKEDYMAYIDFMKSPQTEWIGKKCSKESESWRPFCGPLSPKAVKLAVASINSLLNWLADSAYINNNVLRLIKSYIKANSGSEKINAKVERFLDEEMWDATTATIEKMSRITPAEIIQYERIRFIMSMFSMVGARVNEMSNANMNDFKRGPAGWFWHVLGKGSKLADVAAPQDMIDSLIRWRKALGLTPLPSRHDSSALIPAFNKFHEPMFKKHGLSPRRINELLKSIFIDASVLLADAEDKAEIIKMASAHWLRHTSITQKVKSGMAKDFVQTDARHSDSKTTDQYIHDQEIKRSEESQKHRLRWVD